MTDKKCVSCGGPHDDQESAFLAATTLTFHPKVMKALNELLDEMHAPANDDFTQRIAGALCGECIANIHRITSSLLAFHDESEWSPQLFQWQPMGVIQLGPDDEPPADAA